MVMALTLLNSRRLMAGTALALLAACSATPRQPNTPVTPPVVAVPAAVVTPPKVALAPPELPAPFALAGDAGLPGITPDLTRPPFMLPLDPYQLNGEVTKEFQRGGASWYGNRFHGRRTASGARYDMTEMTAAHRTLPFGTLVRVRSLVTGKEVDVRITDRGPFGSNRIIDLSRAAAEAIGMLDLGVKDVLLLVPDSVTAVATPPTAHRTAPGKRTVVRKKPRRR